VATAAAATAGAASAGGSGGRLRGAAGDGGTEDRELHGGLSAGAVWAGDFLLAVDDDLLESGFALVADVFVDGHFPDSDWQKHYSKETCGTGASEAEEMVKENLRGEDSRRTTGRAECGKLELNQIEQIARKG
jgi:hypothetical protein